MIRLGKIDFISFSSKIPEINVNSIESEIYSKSNNFSEEYYFQNYSDSLISAIQQIDKIIVETEKKFLEIGNNLQQNYRITKEITGSASSAAQLLSGDLMLENIKSLNKIMDSSSIYLSNSMKEIETGDNILKEVLNVLNRAIDNLSGFSRIVKHLRMLGISTKIESARLDISDLGFTTIADNVEKLSTIIHDKSNDIKEQALFLIKTIIDAQSNIEHLGNRQQEHSGKIFKNTKSSFDSLLSRYQAFSENAKTVSNISEQVSESISEIVSSIQTHDIIRQQLNHIKDALSEVLKKIQKEKTKANSGDNSLQNTFFTIYDVCELQSRQLKNSKDEFLKAVVKINKSTKVIDNSFEELSNSILKISGLDINNGSFITEIENGLKQTSLELSNNNNISSELAASMKSVADTVGNLNSYVHEIEEIGIEVEMIALNARVKAAHTGAEGAALGVLAESIQRLSADARSHTTQVSEILTLIMKIAEDLKVNTGLEADNLKNEEINNLNNLIEQLLQSLNEIDKNAITTIKDTQNSILGVKESINSVIGNLEIHDSVDNEISEVQKKINEITESIKKLYTDTRSVKDENIKAFMDHYTTNSERSIHEKMESVKEISKTGLKQTYHHKSKKSEFGDNVELF